LPRSFREQEACQIFAFRRAARFVRRAGKGELASALTLPEAGFVGAEVVVKASFDAFPGRFYPRSVKIVAAWGNEIWCVRPSAMQRLLEQTFNGSEPTILLASRVIESRLNANANEANLSYE
jgi:hypothetical protein